MPRKNPLPTREKEIGERLREARGLIGSRVEAAKRLGIDSSNLANYEHGRAAVPFAVAYQTAALAEANWRWLATGEFPRSGFFELPREFEKLIPRSTPFSKVYDRVLAKNWGAVEMSPGAPLQKIPGAPDWWISIGGASLVPTRGRLLERALEEGRSLPGPWAARFIEAMIEAAGRYIVKHEKQIAAYQENPSRDFLKQQKLLADYLKAALKE